MSFYNVIHISILLLLYYAEFENVEIKTNLSNRLFVISLHSHCSPMRRLHRPRGRKGATPPPPPHNLTCKLLLFCCLSAERLVIMYGYVPLPMWQL